MAEAAEISRQVERSVLAAVRQFYDKAEADGSLGTQIDITGVKGAKPEQLMELLSGEVKRSLTAHGYQAMVRIEKEKKNVVAVYNVDGIRVTVVLPT